MSVILDSTDPDVSGEVVSRLYSRVQLIGQDGHHLTLLQSGFGPVIWHRFEFHRSSVSFVLDPLVDCVALVHVDRGALPRVTNGCYESGLGTGEAFCFLPGLPSTGLVVRSTHDSVILPLALFDKVAADAPGGASKPVRLTGHEPVTPASGCLLRRTLAHLRDTVCADSAVGAHPLIASTASHLLATVVLAVFPSTALLEPTIDDRNDARPAALRRAVSYIDSHADEDVGVADIASAARVSVRTVQYAFRRHLGTTPTAYLRRARLAHAHHDLLTADPTTGVTVTDIAGRWGFFHSGQFATAYRRAYNRLPHHTLHQEGP